MKNELDELFKIAVGQKASDLHLAVGLPPTLRVDGQLKAIDGHETLSHEKVQNLLFGILNEDQKQRLIQERDLDISHEIHGLARFRVNMHWEKGNLGLAARVVNQHIPTMEDMAMPEAAYKLARLKDGLILVTGPTGSGKSTTLAAMVNLINSERRAHIVTLEDPIEFIFTPINCIVKQRELGRDFLSFAAGLKHTLRQDPDIIMVGEMRDPETIAATMTLAETGHLVLATLHTNSAAQTVSRIIDAFPPYQQDQIRVQLSMTMRGVISQRLLTKEGDGRLAAREILLNNTAVASLIGENKIEQINNVIQTSSKLGMTTMDQDIKRLYEAKAISKEAAQHHMLYPEKLGV